jgi:hypothetical protein
MKFWALINNNIVSITAYQEEIPTMDVVGYWVEAPDEYVVVGSSYTGGDFVSSKPVPPILNTITKPAMLNRITDAEFIGILNAAKTDTEVELWRTRFDSLTTFNLTDNSKVITGFSMLVSKGLLTQERATKILTDPIRPEEHF